MPKIKINKFEGLYTNIDENDLRLELFKNSVNFRHEQGYAKYEPTILEEYFVPSISTFYDSPDDGEWVWETGIYALLTRDPLYNGTVTQAQYKCLLLVAKKVDAGYIYRDFWLRTLDPLYNWRNVRLSSGLDLELFKTNLEGKTKLLQDQGVIKVYLPHDCFWIGIIERGFKDITTYSCTSDPNVGIGFTALKETYSPQAFYLGTPYMDRLIEKSNEEAFNEVGNISSTVINSITGFRLPTIIDPLMRLKILTKVNPVRLGTATSTQLYKYIMVRRKHIGYHSPHHMFKFKKLNQSRQETEEWFVGPYCNGENGIYLETATNGTINGYDDLNYRNDVFHLPSDMQNYLNENIALTEVDYYYDRIEKEAFAGPADWVVTATLDRTTEIIVDSGVTGILPANVGAPDPQTETYFLNFELSIPPNCNKRLTNLRVYVRKYFYDDDKSEWKPDGDYNLIKEMDLIKTGTNTDPVELFFVCSSNDITGTLLSQNIAFLYKSPDVEIDYRIVTGFRDYVIKAGVGIGIKYDDHINVYHSIVGGGVLQSDLVYDTNLLQLPGVAFVNALAGLGNKLAVFTTDTMHLINIEGIGANFAFVIQDTLQYGVKNKDDIAEIPGGLIIHTKNGIFTTDGYDKQLLSEPINDIVKANYNTGTIKYNSILHELYYRLIMSEEDLYRYRIDRGTWELLNAIVTEGQALQILGIPA